MKASKRTIWLLMTVLVSLSSFGAVQAQRLVISPESARVPVNGTVRFRAQLFGDSNLSPVIADRIDWRVEPEELGKITEDGFFMAGERPGQGKVLAIAKFENLELRAEAKIEVGDLDVAFRDELILEVEPHEAALEFGQEQQFHARLRFRDNVRIAPDLAVNWTVEPNGIGKISQRGLFKAGDQAADGHVIAYVNYDGSRVFGRAHVVIGARQDAAISGSVVASSNNSPVIDAQVVAQRIGDASSVANADLHWYRRTNTDSSGNYLLEKLIPGRYVVWANGEGFITEFYQEAGHYREATPVAASDDDTTRGIDFTLDQGGMIAGTVYSEVDSMPLPRVHVYAFSAVNAVDVNARFGNHGMTDENGNYLIPNLRSGSYYVTADLPGYQREFFDDADRLVDATVVPVVNPNTTSDVDFALGLNSALSGTVFSDDDSVGIKGALVYAKPLNGPDDLRFKTRTNENGEYVLDLEPGFYLVAAEAEGFNHEFFEDEFDPAFATPVEVLENQHTSGIDFGLAPLSTLTGMVTDQITGDPIANAWVYAYPEVGGGRAVKGITREDGSYSLEGLAPGIYFVKAGSRGYHPEFYTEAETLSDATPLSVGVNEVWLGISFTLSPASIIEGTVLTDQGLPIVRALVVAKMIGSPFRKEALSDTTGNYRIENLPSGNYIVFAMARGYYREFYDNAETRDEATPVELSTSEVESGIDFSLSEIPDNAGAISGFVFDDQDNLPIPGAIMVAVAAQGGPPLFSVTDADGFYGIKGLTNGDYFVMCWAQGYVGEFYDDVQDWRRADLVNVVSPSETPGIDFGLSSLSPGPYRVRGRILSRTEEPVPNALVYAQTKDGVAGFAVSDESGNYVINDLAAGQVKLVATVPGLEQNNDDDIATDDSVSVDLGSGEDDFEFDLTMDDSDFITGVETLDGTLPLEFSLNQNYPNPFNPETEIRFNLPAGGDVTMRIFNILGQEIVTLMSEQLEAGNHGVNWNGLNGQHNVVPSGIYFYSIRVRNGNDLVFQQVRKMTLLR